MSLYHYKVSVIIPCFNVAKYIDRCMNCLGCQTMKDFETICIDDGSSDDTMQMLSKYKSGGGKNNTYRKPRRITSP